MMFGVTQIVVVDDSEDDLQALITGLNQLGAACLGIRYSNAPGEMNIVGCPNVRVVVTDLNLLGLPPSTNFRPLFAAVAGVLREIAPEGPYLLVVWTRLNREAAELRAYLDEQTEGIVKPFNVVPLDKSMYIDDDGNIIDLQGLVKSIGSFATAVPNLAALCDWEHKVQRAASETLKAVSMSGSTSKSGRQQRTDLPKMLALLAGHSVGEMRVTADPFNAITEAFLPILVDQISGPYEDDSLQEAWRMAVSHPGTPSAKPEEAARWNRVFHVAEDIGADQGGARGAVIPLPERLSGTGFVDVFGVDEAEASRRLFRCKNFCTNRDHAKWVLVQAQAACDYAQKSPGPLPFYLGMEIEESAFNAGDKPPQSLWISPKLYLRGSIRYLQVNTRIQLPLVEAEARLQTPLYRIREQLLAQLLHLAQGNSARPGIISF